MTTYTKDIESRNKTSFSLMIYDLKYKSDGPCTLFSNTSLLENHVELFQEFISWIEKFNDKAKLFPSPMPVMASIDSRVKYNILCMLCKAFNFDLFNVRWRPAQKQTCLLQNLAMDQTQTSFAPVFQCWS